MNFSVMIQSTDGHFEAALVRATADTRAEAIAANVMRTCVNRLHGNFSLANAQQNVPNGKTTYIFVISVRGNSVSYVQKSP